MWDDRMAFFYRPKTHSKMYRFLQKIKHEYQNKEKINFLDVIKYCLATTKSNKFYIRNWPAIKF